MEFLTTMPLAGPVYLFTDPRLAGVRKWAVKGFENYLIFYHVERESIEVVRILHGARDIPALFADGTTG